MHKKYYWAALAVVAVLIIVGVVMMFRREATAPEVAPPADTTTSEQATGLPTEEVTPEEAQPEPASAPAKKSVSAGATGLSYGEALEKYKDTRIQLDTSCSAIPNTATYANGTEIMFDNRSNSERTIVFNLKSYKIGAYGFTVVKASASKLPAVTYVDCDGKQNVATVNIR